MLLSDVHTNTWQDVVITTIAALPAVIAAVSSLKNGRTLRNGHGKPDRNEPQRTTKLGTNGGRRRPPKGQKPPADWYQPPDV